MSEDAQGVPELHLEWREGYTGKRKPKLTAMWLHVGNWTAPIATLSLASVHWTGWFDIDTLRLPREYAPLDKQKADVEALVRLFFREALGKPERAS